MADILDVVRIADNAIYLNEDRKDKPKEIFKKFFSIISSYLEQKNSKANLSLLDAGCATGDLLFYLSSHIQEIVHYHGIDISEEMLTLASKRLPSMSFYQGSLDDENIYKQSHDIIICSGVLSCFDDPEPVIANFLNALNPNGLLLIFSPFNEEDVDVISRYRRSSSIDNPWEKGWNIFSKATINRVVKKHGEASSIEWHDFEMPFAIKKTDDPMRTWTIETIGNNFMTVNGACQAISGKILSIINQ